MAGTYYKYAERDADSQINWAEVGREASGMLLEVNRVREEKKDALDKSQREAMSFVANSPNGEHKGSRESILDLADQASNRLRIADKLLKSGQMSPKDVIVFRQNVTDNVNLAFNANKAYQESYKEIMDRARAGDSSGLELNNAEEVEGFGNWKNIGWEISPNGIIMAGKITEEDVDGKKVRTLSKNQGSLRSMDYLNQTIIGRIDKYDYQTPVKNFVDSLGEEKKTVVLLGKIQQQGKVTSVEDITSRKDLDPNTQQELFSFIQAENDKIKEIAGTNLDSARILFDDAKIAPNNKPYRISTNPKEKGEDVILKTVDTDTGGFKYELTAAQKKDAEEFIRTQMRSQYDYKEEGQVVGAVSRDEEPEWKVKKKEEDKAADTATNMIGKLWYGDENVAGSAKDYFKGMKNNKGEILFKDVRRDGTGVTVVLANGDEERIDFLDSNNKPRSQEDFIASAGPLLAGQLDVSKSLKRGSYRKGAKFNPNTSVSGSTVTPQDNYKKYIESTIDYTILGKTEEDAFADIQSLAAAGGMTARQTNNMQGLNVIELKNPTTGAVDEFNFAQSDEKAQKDVFDAMVKFMSRKGSSSAMKNIRGNTTGTVQGVGSKY